MMTPVTTVTYPAGDTAVRPDAVASMNLGVGAQDHRPSSSGR
jgi:hypothetical protein